MLIKPISFWQGKVVVGTTPTAQQFIYLNGYNFYQWKDTRLGLAGTGGLAKIDLTGSLDTAWCTNANPILQTEVRFTTAMNGYIYGDTRNSVGGNQIKKWDSSTGNIIASASVGSTVWGMSGREGGTFYILTGVKGTTYAGTSILGVGKINENMTRDTTFTTNLGTAGGGTGFTQDSFISADRIGVVGQFTSWNGNSSYDRFVVLNYDGTRDTSFVRTGAFSGNINTVIFIDNKWIVGGPFTTYGGVTQNRIMAFNTDGTVDTTFTTNIGSGFNSDVTNITRVSDTQIVVSGAFTLLNGGSTNRIALLNTDGTIPTQPFGTGFGSGNQPNFIGFDNTGKYYIAGAPVLTTYRGATNTSRNFFSLNSDGTVNASFATGSAMRTSNPTPATAEAGGLFVF